ncbi:MAG TPA: hypothetical protein VFV58_01030 [Blastocatellia bacterium]|jgi:hypothetical protein|nr:hypothetical protein [Blastocatellia bacterium]
MKTQRFWALVAVCLLTFDAPDLAQQSADVLRDRAGGQGFLHPRSPVC